MKWLRQFRELAKIAGRKSGIFSAYTFVIYSVFGIAVYLVFFLATIVSSPDIMKLIQSGNMATNPLALGLWVAGMIAFTNAIFLIIGVAIFVALALFSAWFVCICYYYDDCSWEGVAAIQNGIRRLQDYWRRQRRIGAERRAQNRVRLYTEINKLKAEK